MNCAPAQRGRSYLRDSSGSRNPGWARIPVNPGHPSSPSLLTCLFGGLAQRPLHSSAVGVVTATDPTFVICLHGPHFLVTADGLKPKVGSVGAGSQAPITTLGSAACGSLPGPQAPDTRGPWTKRPSWTGLCHKLTCDMRKVLELATPLLSDGAG